MALFGKKAQNAPAEPPTGLAAPVVVNPGDLESVRSLMAQFERAVGSDAGLRSFGVDFNRAGGFTSDLNAMDAMRTNPEATRRPWFWLAAVARQGLTEGDVRLVARVALMTHFWDTQIAPLLGPADWFDGIVDSPSDGARAAIYSVAVEGLPGLPGETVVMTGSMTAADLLLVSAAEALKVKELLAPDARAAARHLLDGPQRQAPGEAPPTEARSKGTQAERSGYPSGRVSLGDGDLARASALLGEIEQAIGNDLALRQACAALSRASGRPEMWSAAPQEQLAMNDDPVLMHRPWYWLSAVAHEACEVRDFHLVARVALFVQFWNSQIAPVAGLADFMDMGLDPTPADLLVEIYGFSLLTLEGGKGDVVVAENSTGVINLLTLQTLCAGELQRLQAAGEPVPPAVSGIVRSLLGRRS